LEITRNYTRSYHGKLLFKNTAWLLCGTVFWDNFCENETGNSERYVCGLHTKPSITQRIQNADNDKLKSIGKETVMVSLRYYPSIILDWCKSKSSVRGANAQNTIPTLHLINASLQHYPHTNTVGVHIHT
jgi:hypothetical protein